MGDAGRIADGADVSPSRSPEPIERAEEPGLLRRRAIDAMGILSQPQQWRGLSARDLPTSLADILQRSLRLDFLYMRLIDPSGEREANEIVHGTSHAAGRMWAAELEVTSAVLAAGGTSAVTTAADGLRLVRVVPGPGMAEWVVVAGSRRPDFPADAEIYLLQATLAQAALALENAWLRDAAQQAAQAKTDFVATVSHELRTPLNAVLGYVDLLLLGLPDPIPSGARQQVERIGVSAQQLLAVVDEILRFSRIEDGQERPAMERVDLCALAGESLALVQPLAAGRGLALRCARPDAPLWCATDPARVRQVLYNLLGNAIKFTQTGTVELVVEREGPWAILSVQDTGPGIPPEHMQRVFEPFHQVERPLTRSAGGTGLGLTVARRLAELLGGTLEAESVPGAGSTFRLRLPCGPR
jgi:signal transduction histidine kinase